MGRKTHDKSSKFTTQSPGFTPEERKRVQALYEKRMQSLEPSGSDNHDKRLSEQKTTVEKAARKKQLHNRVNSKSKER